MVAAPLVVVDVVLVELFTALVEVSGPALVVVPTVDPVTLLDAVPVDWAAVEIVEVEVASVFV